MERSLLCYHGEVTDVLVNSVALLFVVCSLLVRSIMAKDARLEARLFWLGFFACVASVQWLVAELVIAEGISIVWCALLGLSAHSHLSPAWRPGAAAPPSVAEVVCATAAASVGLLSLCHYGRTAPPSSTLAHLLAIAAGFGAGAAAQRWAVAALSGASAVAATAFLAALGLRCRRRVQAARAEPARAARRASEEVPPCAQSPAI